MTSGTHKWIDYDTAPIGKEWQLFRRGFSRRRFDGDAASSPWIQRCEEWELHTMAWARLKEPDQAKARNETRVTFLFEHLNALDTKLGMLLNFNSILLISINVMFGLLGNFLSASGKTPMKTLAGEVFRLHPWTMGFFIVSSGVFALCWFAATMLGLVGERRLVWGDLGLIHEKQDVQRLTPSDLGNPELLERAEQEHVRALIIAVVKRSNKFRIAVGVTYVSVGALAIALVAGSVLLWTTNG